MGGMSFLYDATFRNLAWKLSFIRKILRVVKRSMKIVIILVDTDVDICITRARERAEKVGRPCPDDFVRASNEDARQSALSAKDFADAFFHIRNDASPEF